MGIRGKSSVYPSGLGVVIQQNFRFSNDLKSIVSRSAVMLLCEAMWTRAVRCRFGFALRRSGLVSPHHAIRAIVRLDFLNSFTRE